jgi:HEAT repeat protein
MSTQHSIAEVLHRALKFLQVYGPEDPKAQVVLKGVKQILDEQLQFSDRLEIDASLGRFRLLLNGQPLEGPLPSVKALAQSLTERGILRLSFRPGLQTDELKLLFFILQLRPQRLKELGGAGTFQTELGRILLEEGTPDAPTVKLPTGPLPILEDLPPAREVLGLAEAPPPKPKATQPLGDLARLLGTAKPAQPPAPPAPAPPPPTIPEAPRQPIRVRIAAPVADETVYIPPPEPAPKPSPAPPATSLAPPPRPELEQDIPLTMPMAAPVPLEDEPVLPPPDLALPPDPEPHAPISSLEAAAQPEPPPAPAADLEPPPALAPEPVPPAAAAPPPKPEPEPQPGPEPPAPSGPSLADRFHDLLDGIQKAARPTPPGGFNFPFATEHLEGLRKAGIPIADLSPLAGATEHFGLSQVDPVTLRDALRQALLRLPPGGQGAILTGLATLPMGEPGLRRALDYLAPEMLAQTAAEVLTRERFSTPQLAFLVATLQFCVRDRDLSLEALKGRLQFEGWGIQQLEELQEAILWESQGTDTKLRSALDAKRDMLDLDPTQVIALARQTLRKGELDGFGRILDALESALKEKDETRRVLAARILGDLAECAEDPGIPQAQLLRVNQMAQRHLREEKAQEPLLWSCQAMETLLGVRLRSGDFAGAYREIQSILDMGAAHLADRDLDWKVNAFQDLVIRLAGPLNMAALVPVLHDPGAAASVPQIHSLLSLLGQPAARYLVVCLELEEDKDRRMQLLAAVRAVGRKASLPLREALQSTKWYLVRNAIEIIGEVQDASAFDDVARCLQHADGKVRLSAIAALKALDPSRAAKALGEALPSADPATQLEIAATLGELGQDRVLPDLIAVFKAGKGSDNERLRLRILEAFAALKHPDAIPALQAVFKKKGLLTRLEPVAIRLAAAKALAAIGTREAKEAMALVLEIESAEEVRAVLRQFLVGGP